MIFISIVVVIFMIALIVVPISTKFQRDYNEKQAKIDIRRGHVRLITFGIGSFPETRRISLKYGFEEVGFGCVIGFSPDEDQYNKLVIEYLNKRNGHGWRESYEREVDSLQKVLNGNISK